MATFIKANPKLIAGSTHTINTLLQTAISSGPHSNTYISLSKWR